MTQFARIKGYLSARSFALVAALVVLAALATVPNRSQGAGSQSGDSAAVPASPAAAAASSQESDVVFAAVPEPHAWSTLAASVCLALGLQRFRRRGNVFK